MNIVQLQDRLKNFSQDQLVREMQMPSGNLPQFMVLSEILKMSDEEIERAIAEIQNAIRKVPR